MQSTMMKTLALVTVLTLTAAATAATFPFETGFETDPVGTAAPADFIENVGTYWSVDDSDPVNGTRNYRGEAAKVPSQTITARSVVDLSSSISSGTDFQVTATFRPDSGTTASGSVYYGFLINTTADGRNGYLLRTLGTGVMEIREIPTTGSSSRIGGSSDQGSLSAGNEYLFTATGTYSGGSLSLFFNIEGQGMSGDGMTRIDNTPQENGHFGFQLAATNSATSTRNVFMDIDDFAVVPEPASMALLGIGSLMMLRRRSRA